MVAGALVASLGSVALNFDRFLRMILIDVPSSAAEYLPSLSHNLECSNGYQEQVP